MKEEVLDRTMWRNRFGRGVGLVVRQTTNTGQQDLTFFLAHEEKYLILVELLKLNSNV